MGPSMNKCVVVVMLSGRASSSNVHPLGTFTVMHLTCHVELLPRAHPVMASDNLTGDLMYSWLNECVGRTTKTVDVLLHYFMYIIHSNSTFS
jgi:hypothetical protein